MTEPEPEANLEPRHQPELGLFKLQERSTMG